MWDNVKKLSDNYKQIPPRTIIFDNEKITSFKRITNIANSYFIEKIKRIKKPIY